jgi:hypothetical protein
VKFFFSGSSFVGKYLPQVARVCPWRLMSCHGNYVRYLDVWMRAALEEGNTAQEIMLDSGAFTAWTKGDEVQLKHLVRIYRAFIRKYEKNVSAVWLINLDRIPGAKGREPSPQEITDAMHESDRNLEVLQREFGPIVLPVFHQGEPVSRLRDVAAQADYICVSPRNDLPERLRVQWSRQVHALIKCKTHGLATTGVQMATTVPWHSTDSAAWNIRAALGMAFVNFGDRAVSVFISQDSPARFERGKHYDSMSDVKRAFLRARIEARGFTVEQLRTEMRARAAFSFLELVDWNYGKRFKILDSPTLFGV